MTFNIKAMALTSGIVWGAANLIAGLSAMAGWGGAYVDVMGSVYLGFQASVLGALIGGAWAFVDGLVGGAVFAWLYNKLSVKCG